MSIKDQLYEAIRNKLKAEIEDMDWDDVIDSTAQAIIDDEIGNVQKAAEQKLREGLSDWSGHFGSDDILSDIMDEIMDS